MGSDYSNPIVEKTLRPLGTENLKENEEYVKFLLNSAITINSESSIQKFFPIYFENKPENMILLLIAAIDHIIELSSSPDKMIKTPIETSVCIIKYILIVIDRLEIGNKNLNIEYQDGVLIKDIIPKVLSSILFLSHCTKRSKEKCWGSTTRNDCKFDWLRLQIIDSLIIIKHLCPEVNLDLPKTELLKSAINTMRYYFIPKFRKKLWNQNRRRLLVQATFTLLLMDGTYVNQLPLTSDEFLQTFQPLIDSINHSGGAEEISSYVIPLEMHLINSIDTQMFCFDPSSLQFILNLLYFVDRSREKIVCGCAIFTLSYVCSFTSAVLALNVPCTAFESDWPVHRGTHADLLIEVTSRVGLAQTQYLEQVSDCVALVVPYAANLSYISAVSIFNLIQTSSKIGKVEIAIKLIKAVHFAINRSVRENIPLVIITMKNAKIIFAASKALPEFEEAASISTFIRNVNEELRQQGSPSYKSADLEKFFSDPATEHFANPVLHPPIIDLKVRDQIETCTNILAEWYIGLHITPSVMKNSQQNQINNSENASNEPEIVSISEHMPENEKPTEENVTSDNGSDAQISNSD